MTTLHHIVDRYADWTFRGTMWPLSLFFLFPIAAASLLLHGFNDARWSLLALPFAAATVVHFAAGWHGVKRAFPRLPDAPTCCVADRQVRS